MPDDTQMGRCKLTHPWQSTQDNIQETAASASLHYSNDGRRQDYFLPTAVVLLSNEIIASHLRLPAQSQTLPFQSLFRPV